MNKPTGLDIQQTVRDVLSTVDRKREREIINRRLGLFRQRETLEKIGEFLQLTRERVRQLEKSVMIGLQTNQVNQLPSFKVAEVKIKNQLMKMGNVARISDLTKQLAEAGQHKIHQAQISFLARLSPQFVVVEENEHHHLGIGLVDYHNHDQIKQHIATVVDYIDNSGQPLDVDKIHHRWPEFSRDHLHGLASLSKKLSFLNNVWGLNHWPTVNPKNIRDKIYLVLKQAQKPLHFSEIAHHIHTGPFKKNKVTVQAVHNELIKDDRFILTGRGIYVLKEWGYQPGTVAQVIENILEKSDQPVDRDEIIRQVLKQRQVKPTTISLNLQSKPQFHKLKGTRLYTLSKK